MAQALKLEVILESVDKMTAPIRSALGAGRDLDNQIADLRKELLTLNKTQKNMTAFKELKVKSSETSKSLEKTKINAKKLALQLKDNKVTNQGLAESLNVAEQRTQRLALRLSEAEGPSKRLNKKFEEAQALTNKLTAQFRMAETATDRLSTRFENARNTVNKLKNKQTQEIRSLDQLRAKFRETGISSKRLGQAQKDIAAQTEKATQALDAQAHKLKALHARQKAMNRLSYQKNRSLQAASNITIAGAGGVATGRTLLNTAMAPMQEAMTAESSMADVKKVTNFNPEELKQYGIEIDRLTWKIPLAYEELAAISAEAGQLGIAENEIKAFTIQTAKMSTAFDMLPTDASEASAKLKNIYNLTVQEVGFLGDAINHLSDNSAAKANQMVMALKRIGGTAKQFGLTEIQAASLTNAFIALGKPPEVAGTAINSMLQKLQTAPKQGKKFQAAMKDMGYSSEQLAKDIQTNPQQALMNFLQMLGKVDKQTRAGLTVDLFGTEFSDDVSLLVGNLGKYQDALDLTAQKENYLGSMQREFDTRSATRANQLELLNNQYMSVRRTMGDFLLNAIMPMMPAISEMLTSINQWLIANPELAATIGKIVLGLGTAITVMGGLALAIGSILAPIAMMRYGLGLFQLSKLASGFMIVARAIVFMSMMLMANPIILIITVIAGLAYLIYRNWDTVKQWMLTFWDAIKPYFTAAWEWIKVLWSWSPLGLVVNNWGSIVTWFKGLPAMISSALSGLVTTMKNIGKSIMDGLWGGIKSKIAWIKNKISGFTNSISETVSGVLKINSPSKVFMKIGHAIPEGMDVGITQRSSKVFNNVKKVAQTLPLVAATGMAATSMPAAAQIESIQKAEAKPAAVSRQQHQTTELTIENNFVIDKGMDEHYIADLVEQRVRAILQEQTDNRRGYMFDGAD